jgi:hypothetical protein
VKTTGTGIKTPVQISHLKRAGQTRPEVFSHSIPYTPSLPPPPSKSSGDSMDFDPNDIPSQRLNTDSVEILLQSFLLSFNTIKRILIYTSSFEAELNNDNICTLVLALIIWNDLLEKVLTLTNGSLVHLFHHKKKIVVRDDIFRNDKEVHVDAKGRCSF